MSPQEKRLHQPQKKTLVYQRHTERILNQIQQNRLQFNIINRETLLAAKADPERYKSLIVRIAGHSAYFVELSSDLQNDLIARTDHLALIIRQP